MKKINKVKFVMEVDEYPDFDYIGEYTDDPAVPGIIVRSEDEFLDKLPDDFVVHGRGRESRFFKPYAGGEKEGTKHYYQYGMMDYKRAEGYERGEWCFMVVHAEAEIVTGTKKYGLINVIKSGHLGGIESDSETQYFEEFKEEQLAELRDALRDLGFTTKQINKAFKDVEEVKR